MFKVLVLICLGIFSYANSLSVTDGEIKAHTEVFGDNEIDPITKNVKGDFTINDSIESLKGKIYFETLSLVSEKSDRDENMYELLNVTKFKTISFDISNISKIEDKYQINGTLTLHGISKSISSLATITKSNNVTNLNGNFSILLTEYGIEPPTLLFLTVRDKIDISYNLNLK